MPIRTKEPESLWGSGLGFATLGSEHAGAMTLLSNSQVEALKSGVAVLRGRTSVEEIK